MQFNFRYYLVALIFVVFDVEVIFLYSWAVAFGSILVVGLCRAVMMFICNPCRRLLYAWRKGGLEWR